MYKMVTNMKKLQSLLLGSLLLAASYAFMACKQDAQVAETELQVNLSEATAALAKEPALTYGVKEQVEYDAPKVIRYDPLTGEKKTLFTPPDKPADYSEPAPVDLEAIDKNITRQTLPNVPLNPHLKANLSGFWSNAKATMFDAAVASLNGEELKAFSKLEAFIGAPFARSNTYLNNFAAATEIDGEWLLDRLYFEVAAKASGNGVAFDAMQKSAKKYLGDNFKLSGSNTSLLKYDVKEQIFTVKDKNKLESAAYLGQSLIDPSITAMGSDYYIKGHEIQYRSLKDFVSKSKREQLADAGIITCGDWLIGYFDNRFPETSIENGGIIFAEYNWLDAKYYLLRYDAGSKDYVVAEKGGELGTESKENYKARPVSPQPVKNVTFDFSKLKLRIGEEFLAAALPITARYSEQVISRFDRQDEVIYLNLPFNDMYLVFSLNGNNKRPAFVNKNILGN